MHAGMVSGQARRWRRIRVAMPCGARYLYVTREASLAVSQQRGTPGIPLLDTTHADMDREYPTESGAPQPAPSNASTKSAT